MTKHNLLTFERIARRLTAQRMQIMLMVADGLTNEEIGQQLSLSPRTVESHRSHALNTMGFKNSTEFLCAILRG